MGDYVKSDRMLKTRSNITKTVYQFGDDIRTVSADYSIPAFQHVDSFRTGIPDDVTLLNNADKIFVNGFKTNFRNFGNDREANKLDDTGHEFWTYRSFTDVSHFNGSLRQNEDVNSVPRIDGAIIVYDSAGLIRSEYQIPNRLTDTEIAYYGHKAIANTVPSEPGAHLTDFVTQTVFTPRPKFIGDIPAIQARFLNFRNLTKDLGSQYVNLKFGWVPLTSDLRDLLNVVLNSYKEMQNYEKGNGKVSRRDWTFPVETNESTLVESFNGVVAASQNDPRIFGNRTFGTITQVDKFSRRLWFSGAYTYYLNVGAERRSRMEKYASLAQKLLGLKWTPDVIWDLAPWTWLIDWRLDLTSMLDIQTAFSTDNLVMRYGYLMCETRTDRVLTLSGLDPNFGSRGPFTNTLSVISKERVQATPYGFGIDPTSFTLEQLAILAGLGISKIPRVRLR